MTRDGRRCIELREVIPLTDNKYYAAARATIYSIAYESQVGRIVAFARATNQGHKIIDYIDGSNNRAVFH